MTDLQTSQCAPVVVPVAPVHLKSMGEICATFSKTRETIKTWYDLGAPIAFDGERYSAEYNQLQAWLVRQYAKKEEN